MEKKELVKAVLAKHSCLNAKEISAFARRLFNEEITPSSASGVCRAMYDKGLVGKSSATGKTVYWLTEEGKR